MTNTPNEHTNDDADATRKLTISDLPSFSSDDTIASPALGYGMERKDMLSEQQEQLSSVRAKHMAPIPLDSYEQDEEEEQDEPSQPSELYPESIPDPQLDYDDSEEPLSRNEVAAVSEDRSYYVSDVATPYLSSKQAEEDIRVTKRRRTRTRVVIILVLLLVAVGAGVWAYTHKNKSEAPQDEPEYVTATITHGEFLDTLEATALIRPIDEQSVSPNISGTIASANVEEGSEVERGYVIFTLESPTIRDAVQKAQEALESAQADVDAREQTLGLANDVLNDAQKKLDEATKHREELNKRKRQTSTEGEGTNEDDVEVDVTEEVDETELHASIDRAKIEVEKAEAQLRDAQDILAAIQQTYDLAVEQQDSLVIHAPISGVVTHVNEDKAKESAAVSRSTQLCSIEDTSSLRLEIEIPEKNQKRVREGLEARITFPSIPDLSITSSVTSVEDRDGIKMAIIALEDPDERITTEMTAHASLILRSVPDSLIVPVEAVQSDEESSSYLNVLLDPSRGIVTKVPVKVIAQSSDEAAVEADNIQADNTVIVGIKNKATDK